MTPQVTITNEPPPTAARRGRKTGETYETWRSLPFDQWATVTFTDGAAANAAASTFRTIARREKIQVSILTDRDDETLLYVQKIAPGDE